MDSRQRRLARLTVASLGLLIAAPASLAGVVPAGQVSGTWSLADSPYLIDGEIEVPLGAVLAIEPGVEVRFRGHYALAVRGQLLAVGAPGDTILFHAENPATGWHGLRFFDTATTAQPASEVRFCRIQDGLATRLLPCQQRRRDLPRARDGGDRRLPHHRQPGDVGPGDLGRRGHLLRILERRHHREQHHRGQRHRPRRRRDLLRLVGADHPRQPHHRQHGDPWRRHRLPPVLGAGHPRQHHLGERRRGGVPVRRRRLDREQPDRGQPRPRHPLQAGHPEDHRQSRDG